MDAIPGQLPLLAVMRSPAGHVYVVDERLVPHLEVYHWTRLVADPWTVGAE